MEPYWLAQDDWIFENDATAFLVDKITIIQKAVFQMTRYVSRSEYLLYDSLQQKLGWQFTAAFQYGIRE